MEKISRDITIDFVRIVACFAVVLMHVISVFWYPIPVKLESITSSINDLNQYVQANYIGKLIGSWQWYALSFFDAITRFSVPIFVMVSGAMVLKKKEIPIKYGFTKVFYICKIIILWGGVLTLLLFLINLTIEEHQSVLYYVQTLVNGGGVFWFLYMLMPLYLSSAIYKAIVRDNNALFMFVFLWFIMAIILSSLKAYYPGLVNNIKFEYLSQFSIYSGYFVLGHILYSIKYNYDKELRLTLKQLLNISYIVVVLMLIIMTFGKPVSFFHNFSSPVCALLSVSMYWILINMSPNKNILITKIASSTLGIYAIHMLYIKIFTYIMDVETIIRSDFFLIHILSIWLLVVLCSYLTVRFLKYIPFLRNI